MPTVLVVDCETTGLMDRALPVEHPAQPDVVELAMLLAPSMDDEPRVQVNLLLATGRVIPEEATTVHGLDAGTLQATGIKPRGAVELFVGLARKAAIVVAHNADFERDMLAGSAVRHGHWNLERQIVDLPWFCTMRAATPLCRLPPKNRAPRGDRDWKYPSLDEACLLLLNEPNRQGQHSAYDDAWRTLRLYRRIIEMGVDK